MPQPHISSFVDAIDVQAHVTPDRLAFDNSQGEKITYRALSEGSDALARMLLSDPGIAPHEPLLVYGHKSPLMLVCFLACAKSGHAYVPVDIAFPPSRIRDILEQIGWSTVLDTSRLGIGDTGHSRIIPRAMIEGYLVEEGRLMAQARTTLGQDGPRSILEATMPLPGLDPEDTFYILFTSGSSGAPKGVEISRACVDNFCSFMRDEFACPDHRIFFNKVPFSFDVSLTDMVLGLTNGDTLFALEREDEQSLADSFSAFTRCHATDWISTPSFVSMCLADDSFNADLMPDMRTFFLAGEVLTSSMVREIMSRFPQARVINGYGPTESTDVVTTCIIDDAMLAAGETLPIGYAKSGTDLKVLDPQTLEEVPDGQPGELFIIGDTVGKGYFKRPDLTSKAFGSCPPRLIGEGQRAYRTGDEVTRTKDGLYHYRGRLDLQIKLHGYRVELGDIESNLCSLPDVRMACVLPVMRDGSIAYLAAYVVPTDLAAPRGFAQTKRLKSALGDLLPAYMVPHRFRYCDDLPLNSNGKVDRKALAQSMQDSETAQNIERTGESGNA